jgi:hypothetical protein
VGEGRRGEPEHSKAQLVLAIGSLAVVGSFVASGGRRRGGGEDPWLCDPGFRRVCLLSRDCEHQFGQTTGVGFPRRDLTVI